MTFFVIWMKQINIKKNLIQTEFLYSIFSIGKEICLEKESEMESGNEKRRRRAKGDESNFSVYSTRERTTSTIIMETLFFLLLFFQSQKDSFIYFHFISLAFHFFLYCRIEFLYYFCLASCTFIASWFAFISC